MFLTLFKSGVLRDPGVLCNKAQSYAHQSEGKGAAPNLGVQRSRYSEDRSKRDRPKLYALVPVDIFINAEDKSSDILEVDVES